LFNNYGPKPNSELILGYGFSLTDKPVDTIVLKVGGGHSLTKKWVIGRNAAGMDGLWVELLSLVIQDPSQPDGGYDDHLEASSLLEDMTRSLLTNVTEGRDLHQSHLGRPEVRLMLEHYLEGK
jgi:hypothetical protein